MPNKELLRAYAKLIAQKGLNVQAGQPVLINASVEVYEFVRLLVEECYNLKAKTVIVDYSDSFNNRAKINNESLENLENVPQYIIDKYQSLVDEGVCRISLTSPNPQGSIGIDIAKQKAYNLAYMSKTAFLRKHFMDDCGQWCVAAVPTEAWANQVFPNATDGVDKLWEAIFKACHVSLENTLDSWDKHSQEIQKHATLLNELELVKLTFKNSLGTNLEVGLAEKHLFAGGDEYTTKGVCFAPNIPTEEVFTMPHKDKVNGVVYASKPLNYNGGLIKDFYLEFKDGKVVKYDAKEGLELLKSLIEFDEGSAYLGEVALLSYESSISLMNILFYNTLFDENASCHLALGAAYAMNTENGINLSEEELIARGCNMSKTHVDFMFGTSDMEVIGYTKDGKVVEIFKNGNFII